MKTGVKGIEVTDSSSKNRGLYKRARGLGGSQADYDRLSRENDGGRQGRTKYRYQKGLWYPKIKRSYENK